MPELPDVEIFGEHIKRTCLGRIIDHVEILDAGAVREMPPKIFADELTGDEIVTVSRYGKYLFIKAEGKGFITMHFGMTGYPKYLREGEDRPEYTRVAVHFKGGGSLAYVDQRLLGKVGLITSDISDFIREKGLGPDALDIDNITFAARLARVRGAIKPALMDKKFIAGIGNVYADEILFQARVHPETSGMIVAEKGDLLYSAMRETLRTAIKKYDDPPVNFLLRQRHKGGRCPGCGNRLAFMKINGRTAYFCPIEQTLEAEQRAA